MSEGSSNITMKLKYIIIITNYSFTVKLHCLINTATALLELLTDCSIRVSRSFMTKDGGHVPPPPPDPPPENSANYSVETSARLKVIQ